jgi:hypothetical protein
MTICTGYLFGADISPNGFVNRYINLVLSVTAHTKRIYLCRRIHNIRRRDVIFVGAVGIRSSMALLAANVGLGVYKSKCLVLVVYMTDMASAVIRYRAGRRTKLFSDADFLKQ